MQIEGRGIVTYKKKGMVDLAYRIAPLILMVFVENAFKHSAEKKSEGIEIKIDISLDNRVLAFDCENNYDPEEGIKNEQGIGLENVRKRLDFIYPDSHQLNIHQSNTNYHVQLMVDLIT
jgi:two-component system LytT family sensor kinase